MSVVRFLKDTVNVTMVYIGLPAGSGLGNVVKVLSQACPGNVGDTGLLSYGKPTVTRIEMPAGTCSVTTGTACDNDSDCPAGTCSATTGTACHLDGDCPAAETCAGGGEYCTASCNQENDLIRDCPAANTAVTVTITGTNFGAENAIVLIGGKS